jgi:organic hydroperoxide reductase OsmC/OhrA
VIRRAKAVWRGIGHAGNGYLSTDSGVLERRGSGQRGPERQGFASRSALTPQASVPNVDETKFRKLAGVAEKSCPISKVLDAQITLDATLEATT